MRDDVRQALEIGPDSPMEARTVDITTTGRRSGEPRRIELAFRRVKDTIYLTGVPMQQPRSWLLNLTEHPEFTFHLKNGVVADLPATATVITDPGERRQVLTPIVEEYNALRDPNGPYPVGVIDEWVQYSPLARVEFDPSA